MPDQFKPKVAGIIMAAGAASRMGRAKLLLPWKGETLIHRAARIALEAGLSPVVVVTGSWSEDMIDALQGLLVQVTYNPHWAEGQSTSVRVGIENLTAEVDAAVFLLGDQPFISPELILELVKTFSDQRPMILAPYIWEKRANPVLFDRSIFSELLHLEGDAGARSIFGKYPPVPMPWHDERLLIDVDTPEDYERLTKNA